MIELLLLSEKLSQAYSLLEIAKTSPLGTTSQVPVFQAVPRAHFDYTYFGASHGLQPLHNNLTKAYNNLKTSRLIILKYNW